MLRPLQLEDREMLEEYLYASSNFTCELAFANLYLWRRETIPYWQIFHNHLYIIFTKENVAIPVFSSQDEPSPNEFTEFLQQDELAGKHLAFYDVEADWVKRHELELNSDFRMEPMPRDFSEYIYRIKSLYELHGSKLAKKKNLIHQFHENYSNISVEQVSPENLNCCLDLADRWMQSLSSEEIDNSIRDEADAIHDLPSLWGKFPMEGILLKVDGYPVSFSVFSPISSQVWTEHFEKTDYRYKGASQYINHVMAETLIGRVEFINREQDLGYAGMRQAKLSYNPEILLSNYFLHQKT